MKTKTRSHARAAEKSEPVERWPACWWNPQLDTALGRVELNFHRQGTISVHRAGWLNLESGRRLTQHHDDIGLTRDPKTGRMRLTDVYRNIHDKRVAEMLLQAATAWAAANADLLRRCLASEENNCHFDTSASDRADKLSANLESGLFDFDDAGHARKVAAKAAARLQAIVIEMADMEAEIRRAIDPPTENETPRKLKRAA